MQGNLSYFFFVFVIPRKKAKTLVLLCLLDKNIGLKGVQETSHTEGILKTRRES